MTMTLLRIRRVWVLDGFQLELTLTDGSVVQRDVAAPARIDAA
jgi:hypothetical protein